MVERQIVQLSEQIQAEINDSQGNVGPEVKDPNLNQDNMDNSLEFDDDLGDNDDSMVQIMMPPPLDEDYPDPFEPSTGMFNHQTCSVSQQPQYLIVVYMLAAWLHLQWHLPRLACNAFLAIMACLVLFLSPGSERPFVTLQSATQVLSLNLPVTLLPTCPGCRDIYPPTSSPYYKCTTCKTHLFLPDRTKCGNQHLNQIPYIKYPYLPLLVQIHSLLAIPGVEDSLDAW